MKINPKELKENLFSMVGDQWMLLAASKPDGSFNTMTVSWGTMGILWNKSTATAYVRESRYTKEFVDANDIFTLSVFEGDMKKALGVLGTKSGRDIDKQAFEGLTPIKKDGAVCFEEAKLTFVCKKLYKAEMPAESFVDKSILDNHYSDNDMHTMYIGEIIECFGK